MFRSFETCRGIKYCAVNLLRETENSLCTVFKFYAHAHQVKNEEDYLQTINICYVTLYHSTAHMAPSLKYNYSKGL